MKDISDIDRLNEFRLLRDLNLRGNELNSIDDYRLSVIFKLQQLTTLDRRKIDAAEKVIFQRTLLNELFFVDLFRHHRSKPYKCSIHHLNILHHVII